MAGDWLKVEKITPDKPEIEEIAAALDMDPDAVFGKCFRVWRWFDDHTEDGNAPRVTKASIDRRVGVVGFAAAMQAAGWLAEVEGGVSLVNFDRHNGETSKARALTAKRVARHKATSNAKANAESVTTVTREALPREEKRIEEKSNTPPKPPQGGEAAEPKPMDCPPLEEFPEAIRDETCRAAWQLWLAYKRQIKEAARDGRVAFLGALTQAKRREWKGVQLKLYRENLAKGEITPDGEPAKGRAPSLFRRDAGDPRGNQAALNRFLETQHAT
jgi:hypothetical protein